MFVKTVFDLNEPVTNNWKVFSEHLSDRFVASGIILCVCVCLVIYCSSMEIMKNVNLNSSLF